MYTSCNSSDCESSLSLSASPAQHYATLPPTEMPSSWHISPPLNYAQMKRPSISGSAQPSVSALMRWKSTSSAMRAQARLNGSHNIKGTNQLKVQVVGYGCRGHETWKVKPTAETLRLRIKMVNGNETVRRFLEGRTQCGWGPRGEDVKGDNRKGKRKGREGSACGYTRPHKKLKAKKSPLPTTRVLRSAVKRELGECGGG